MLSALLQYFVKNLQRCTQNNTKLQTLQKLQIPRQMLIPGPNNQQTLQKLYFPYNLETLHNLQFLAKSQKRKCRFFCYNLNYLNTAYTAVYQ